MYKVWEQRFAKSTAPLGQASCSWCKRSNGSEMSRRLNLCFPSSGMWPAVRPLPINACMRKNGKFLATAATLQQSYVGSLARLQEVQLQCRRGCYRLGAAAKEIRQKMSCKSNAVQLSLGLVFLVLSGIFGRIPAETWPNIVMCSRIALHLHKFIRTPRLCISHRVSCVSS